MRRLLLRSPWWGGVGGGGREVGRERGRLLVTSRPPTPTLPHKGGGSRSRKRRVTRLNSTQFHQARQKSRQGLAATGRRDQQHRAPGLGLGQQIQLMRARRPAAAGEPTGERLRQDIWAFENGHPPEVMGRGIAVEGCATTTRLSTGTPFSLRTAALARCAGTRPAAPSTPRT